MWRERGEIAFNSGPNTLILGSWAGVVLLASLDMMEEPRVGCQTRGQDGVGVETTTSRGLRVGSQHLGKVVVMLRFRITVRRCQLRQKSPAAP